MRRKGKGREEWDWARGSEKEGEREGKKGRECRGKGRERKGKEARMRKIIKLL